MDEGEGRYICVWNGDRSKLQVKDTHRFNKVVFQGNQVAAHKKADGLNADYVRERDKQATAQERP